MKGLQIRSASLVALVLVTVLLFRAGAFQSNYSPDHSRHFCGVCHFKHTAAAQPVAWYSCPSQPRYVAPPLIKIAYRKLLEIGPSRGTEEAFRLG
jgi:hypothetical protein